MQIDLRDIIDVPGGMVSFDYEPILSGFETGSQKQITGHPRAVGTVRNAAGVLTLSCELQVTVICICARCLKETETHKSISISAVLSENEEDSDEFDVYELNGTMADIDEIVRTAFVLEADERFLCREDCKGLCPTCGADLNEGLCSCKKEIDPRFAVLGQLLEND